MLIVQNMQSHSVEVPPTPGWGGEDRRKEEEHIRTALHTCGYPDWAINRVKDQMNSKKATRKDKNNNNNNNNAQNK